MRYLLLVILVVACTKPGEKTGIGAATGGAIGAGLGAIVGNQVGNPGQGLVVGAAVGAGTGALVANAFEAQDEVMRQQDEAMERQEQLIRAQRNQIESMRAGSDQRAGFTPENFTKSDSRFGKAAPGDLYLSSIPAENRRAPINSVSTLNQVPVHQEPLKAEPLRSEIVPPKLAEPAVSDVKAGMKPLLETDIPVSNKNVESPTVNKNSIVSSIKQKSCPDAQPEIQKAEDAQDAGDKLFHYRRALRICPRDAATHVKIGDLYLSLGRKEDALFEYEEAQKLDPSLAGLSEKIEASQR